MNINNKLLEMEQLLVLLYKVLLVNMHWQEQELSLQKFESFFVTYFIKSDEQIGERVDYQFWSEMYVPTLVQTVFKIGNRLSIEEEF